MGRQPARERRSVEKQAEGPSRVRWTNACRRERHPKRLQQKRRSNSRRYEPLRVSPSRAPEPRADCWFAREVVEEADNRTPAERQCRPCRFVLNEKPLARSA